jgi:hypothetical protein
MRFVRRNATYKGLLGGSRGWLAVFGALGAVRFFGKYVGRDVQHVSTEKLLPGQSMTITALAAASRAERSSAKRAGKAATQASARSTKVAKRAARAQRRSRRAG